MTTPRQEAKLRERKSLRNLYNTFISEVHFAALALVGSSGSAKLRIRMMLLCGS